MIGIRQKVIISENTIWSTEQTWAFEEIVQIPYGVELTIRPDANVKDTRIQVFGSLVAQGDINNTITFENVDLYFGSDSETPAFLDLDFVEWQGGSFLDATGNASYGSFDIDNNYFDGVDGFYIWYPTSTSSIKSSSFVNSQGLSVGSRNLVTIENNNFIASERPYNGSEDVAIVNWASYGPAVAVTGNNFYGTTKVFELAERYSSAAMEVGPNYYSTSEIDLIEALILDNADSLERAHKISADNFLLSPNYLAPDMASDDLIVGDELDNQLWAGSGNDTLEGRTGNDILTGGSGSDIFKFSDAHGQDTITDFNFLEDKIEYSGSNQLVASWRKSLNNAGHDIINFDNDFEENLLVVEIENSAHSLKFNQTQSITLELIENSSLKNITVDALGNARSVSSVFNSVKIQGISDVGTQFISTSSEADPITISDVVAQLREIVGLENLQGKAHAAADINDDGEVQISDVVSNLRHIVGLQKLDTFDLVTENGFAINALAADSIGNLSIVINGDADQSHADWIALTDTSVSGTNSDDIIDLNSSDYKLARQTIAVDGGAGNDEITGSIADENIVGGAGNDKLLGGGGRNTLTGGAGADEFQFDKSSLNTFVTDFSLSEGDSLKFINHSDDSFSFDKNSIRPNSESDGLLIDYIADGSSGTFDLSLGLKDVSLHTNGALKADAGNGSWFDRSISVNGLELVVAGEVGGQAAVPNDWVYKVAQTVNLLIDPYADGIDLSAQNEMIEILSGEAGTWHAGLPTAQRVANGEGNSYSPNPLYNPESYTGYEAWLDSHMQNDMVWYYDPEQISTSIDEQINEVLEHLMHTIHVFGVRGAVEGSYDALMGTDIEVETSQDYKNQDLYLAMTEAKANGIFDPDYDHLPDNVLMKEYTYLLNYNMWELGKIFWEDDNGDGLGSLAPEWSNEARTPAGILQNNPLGYELFEKYFDPVLSKPDAQALRNLFDESTVGASNYSVGFSALPGTDEFLLSVQIETI
jgi:Ca2+-binding RTX toxin-like protein